MNVFKSVKQSVTSETAACFYGVPENKVGMAVCPFHDDHAPSLKLDKRFHCFGCGADGDVIDFVFRLFHISKTDAAKKLADDFNIDYDENISHSTSPVPHYDFVSKEEETHCINVLSDYHLSLKDTEAGLAPKSPDEEVNSLYVLAVKRKDYVESLLDMFIYGDRQERIQWIQAHRKINY